MPREKRVTALIIKKQPLGEADEIITLFSRESGKLRVVTKSSKLSTSKMQYALQPLFIVDVTLAGNSSLPKLIRSQIVETHSQLQSHPERVALWYVVGEMLIKLLPDEAPNEQLYDATVALLTFLNDSTQLSNSLLELALLQYKITAMERTGLGVHSPGMVETDAVMLFSTSKGGFYTDSTGSGVSVDARPVNKALWQGFRELQYAGDNFLLLHEYGKKENIELWLEQLDRLLTEFVAYQLDREIKSEKFLRANKNPDMV